MAWEDNSRGEELPALPSGLDAGDRKRVRTISEDTLDEGNKRSKLQENVILSEDVDQLGD